MNITLLIGGIALFIYSLEAISKSLISASIPKIKPKIETLTSSDKKAFITGFCSTLITQSSSAIILLTITLINANILSFNQSIGIVLGSNIATTLSSIFIGINIEKIAPIIMLISLLLTKSKNQKISSISKTIFFISLLFFSIFLLSFSMSSLKENSLFILYVKKATENSFLSLIIGVLLTAVLQSSSLFITILQILSNTNIITIMEALPLILGANIGTSFDALLTLFSSNKESRKLAHFSIFFNVITSLIFFIFLTPFSFIITLINNIFSLSNASVIAIANILFNLGSVIITIPLINKIKRYYSKW
ncbi:MAG: Na/Pi cotransporter family protein [Bacilli bacterium]|nr:Na/Pi cotransporter family protein [Bacilli bacterium]